MQGIIFDLDGTILDTYELISRSFHHAMVDVLGADRPMDVFEELLGRPLSEQMAYYAGGSDSVLDALLKSYRAHNHAIEREAIHIFDGMAPMLEQLRFAGWKLGIATSKRHETAASNLGVFGLLPLFSCLVGFDDVNRPKPDPQSILVAASQMGLAAADCFYVGDSPFDIQAGNAAGCPTVAVLWGQHPRDRLLAAGPTLVCEAVADLPALVQRYNAQGT